MIAAGICVLIIMVMIGLIFRYYDVRFRGKTFWVCDEKTGKMGNLSGDVGNIIFDISKDYADTITIEGIIKANVYCCDYNTIISNPFIFKVTKDNRVYKITSEQFEGIAWYSDIDGFCKYRNLWLIAGYHTYFEGSGVVTGERQYLRICYMYLPGYSTGGAVGINDTIISLRFF